MKYFAYALLLSAAFYSAPALANAEDQYNTHGRYQYYQTDRAESDDMLLNSADIAQIQRSLHEVGYNPGPVDGVYGPRTRGALRSFQNDHYLHGDGQLTERTLKALDIPYEREKPMRKRIRHYN